MSARTALRLAFASTLVLAATAHAQLFRAYLASDGNDANPCTRPQPCRLLPAALTAVAAGGEIWMLDSANYNTGPVAVGKSVTILAIPGAHGSVVSLGGPALQFNTASTRVTLRNLEVVPFPGNEGQQGISVAAAMTLLVHRCAVRGFTSSAGLNVAAAAAVSLIDSTFMANQHGAVLDAGSRVQVTGSTFDRNLDTGILARGGATATRVAITRSTASRNGSTGFAALALNASSQVEMSIIDSSANHNGANGVSATVPSVGSTARLTIMNSQLTSNTGVGALSSGVGARVTAAGNSVSYNGTGFQADTSGVFESRFTNVVQNNAPNTNGSITGIPGK